jgi:type III restriction enzyme
MLTEGWDAQNVTQILGLRRFDSQLLCEQVVGRGLRRTNYDDLSEPEYVDVYGVPFEVIPVKKASLTRPNPPQRLPTLVRALPERKALEIKFPRVEGYIFDIRRKVIANIDKIPVLYVSPANEPTEAIAKPASGVITERPSRLGPGQEKTETREEYLKAHRLQTTIFEIASEVTRQLAPETRSFVFPQVLEITKQFVEKRVKVKPGATIDELALRRYSDPIISRLCDAVQPDVESGEAPLLPRIERHREYGSTSEVRFSTLKEAFGTIKSHVSHVVTDSGWEHKIAYELDKNPDVVAYVKNDHLDFTIPYEWEHEVHSYYPDFIIRLKMKDGSEINVILEVKGYETEKDRAKKPAAQRWISAVNHHGGYGKWILKECRSPYQLPKILENTKHEAEELYCRPLSAS